MTMESQLRHLSVQRVIRNQDFSGLSEMADQSQSLTWQNLQLIQAQPHNSSALPLPLAQSPASCLNVHTICENALLYSSNSRRFHQVAHKIPTRGQTAYCCTRCDMRITQTSLRLSKTTQDRVWIGPSGMLKAHCMLRGSEAPGWTCIWKKISRECYLRFDGERDLLKHVKSCHLNKVEGRGWEVEWPNDARERSVGKCGFGVVIGGKEMLEGDGCFVVPRSVVFELP
ncbi:hypothetical protein EJ04DRAFT_31766 [Polyplosphaeria fusca]|uniref:C2H2-type domain-containing protein n=1 Tax=Polyplosphaeria fusca TaxID=682080 RepID=A0A9P4UZ87_9PLEO|nr:hypothetical protein EJ04DRAFT_31766 [Polyplosphaeria fusca]